MSLPVVASPEAVRGIDGILPDSISIANQPEDYAELGRPTLLAGRQDMSMSGRFFVKKYYDWELKGIPLRIDLGPRDIKNTLIN